MFVADGKLHLLENQSEQVKQQIQSETAQGNQRITDSREASIKTQAELTSAKTQVETKENNITAELRQTQATAIANLTAANKAALETLATQHVGELATIQARVNDLVTQHTANVQASKEACEKAKVALQASIGTLTTDNDNLNAEIVNLTEEKRIVTYIKDKLNDLVNTSNSNNNSN